MFLTRVAQVITFLGLLCLVDSQTQKTELLVRPIFLDEASHDAQILWDTNTSYDVFEISKFGVLKSNYKISFWFSNYTLKGDDSQALRYSVNGNEFETVSGGLEISGAENITLKKFKDWQSTASMVTFVATLYTEVKAQVNCPVGLIKCSENSENDISRCIYKDLCCNGRNNCGKDDSTDEDCQESPSNNPNIRPSWYDVQYLLTILLAGLFFILSPICIVIFLFYHRRMSAAAARSMGRRPGTTAHVNEAYTTSPPNDMPPSYEDVHDTKTPPPPFDYATSSERSPESHPGPSASVLNV